MAPAELSPTAVPGKQVATLSAQATTPTPAQAAWQRFVDQVERGEIKDPSGQYVAKGIQGLDASGRRATRPKFDAASPDFAQRFSLVAKGTTEMVVAPGASTPAFTQPNNPPCDGCGPGGPSTPPVYSTFTSPENLGGSGYIHDLKLVTDANSPSRDRALSSGYTFLNADLNKGAGGSYIYFCFQRNPSNVLDGLEYYQGKQYSGPNDFLTNFQTQNGNLFGSPTANPYFFDIWTPNQNPYNYWTPIDLNAGAGGSYIYSFQSKTPFVRQQSGGSVQRPAFLNMGILSGNSSSIQPPTGWRKYPNDLNEGAGGDFIYFCYKY